MSEYLSFNKSGQWELHKATNFNDGSSHAPKDAEVSGNKPFKVFRGAALRGELHADNGQRGELHDFNGGIRPKKARVNWKNVGKPDHPVDSMYSERNPGEGDN